MLYYIKTQFGRSLTDKYFRVFIIGILAAVLLANLAMTAFRDIIYGMNDGTFAYNLIMFAKGFFWLPYYCLFFVADEVIGSSYPDPRLRDKSTIGLSRKHIFFGKLITEILVLFVCALFATVAFLVITPIFQVHDGTIDITVIMDFLEAVLLAMPLFIAGISIANMLCFAFVPRKKALLMFVLFVIIIPRVIILLATDGIGFYPAILLKNILLTPQFQELQFFATRNVPKVIISSLIYFVLSSAYGVYCFEKKEF
ncbi:MAG: hypothetical protein K5668_03600 [Lachnospiraceae bacterium]|nr:hypothetical protein [Lachnospiraceae bacterium]